MCWKIDRRIECLKCGYPYSEARYPDTGLHNCDGSIRNVNAKDEIKHGDYLNKAPLAE